MIVEASNSPSPLANRWSGISNNLDIPRLEYLSIHNEAAPFARCSLVVIRECVSYWSSAKASLIRRMASMMFSSLVA